MAAILIFAYSWVPGGMDIDSCNYATVAKEILRTNKWLNLYDPVYQGVFYYHFPLCIWITALFFKLFGVTTFSAKLFSMISAFILAGAIFYFGRLLKNNWTGFFAGVSFLFTNHIVRLSRQCRMDLPVSLFITLAIFSFVLAQKRSRLYYLLFGLFTSLAILAKDVSGLAPLVIIFIYLLLRWRIKELFHPLFILGILCAILPVLSWIWLDHKALFTPWLNWNFLHLLRTCSSHPPWHYYIWAIITKYFYFLPFAVYGGYLAIKEARNNKNYEFYLLIIWAIIFPLAFSFGRQKLHYFILPIYVATSLLAGIAFERLLKDPVKLKVFVAIKYTLIAAGIIMFCFPVNISSRRFSEIVRMAPLIDQIVKQMPEYEFFVYKEDVASILFYSQQLSRVNPLKDKALLEEALSAPSPKARLCYMKKEDFIALSAPLREKCQTVLQYKEKLLVMIPKEPRITVVLP